MNDLQEWLDKTYPDGNIDWKQEYERLVSILEQALPTLNSTSHAIISTLNVAVQTGIFLLGR
jgi:hypothetical protein